MRKGASTVDIEQIFPRTRFSSTTIRQAVDKLPNGLEVEYGTLRVSVGLTTVSFDSIEDWYGEYAKAEAGTAYLVAVAGDFRAADRVSLQMWAFDTGRVEVRLSGADRAALNTVLNVFTEASEAARLPDPPKPPPTVPRIFIGHGHSGLWRDLKDHLHERQGYDVEAFETGERAGHVVRDVLEGMLDSSAFALLVLTGEDEQADGELRPRENVVHEVGLFQGRLGFHRAIALVEEGVTPFSNLDGVLQLRFSRGNIKETYGDVLGVLRREFGS